MVCWKAAASLNASRLAQLVQQPDGYCSFAAQGGSPGRCDPLVCYVCRQGGRWLWHWQVEFNACLVGWRLQNYIVRSAAIEVVPESVAATTRAADHQRNKVHPVQHTPGCERNGVHSANLCRPCSGPILCHDPLLHFTGAQAINREARIFAFDSSLP